MKKLQSSSDERLMQSLDIDGGVLNLCCGFSVQREWAGGTGRGKGMRRLHRVLHIYWNKAATLGETLQRALSSLRERWRMLGL